MIDSHAHLAMFAPAEIGPVLDHALAAGVSGVLVPATGPGDLDQTLTLAREWPGRVVVAVGVHPHEARALDAACKRRLEGALLARGVVAIGEIGLDYYYDHSPREDQRAAFAWQLGLAREHRMPVVLHQREAWHDFLAALDAVPGLAGVAHSFTEGAGRAHEVMARGLMLGISGMVTFARAENIRDAVAIAPEGKLLVETDSPYLTPVPHRGARNEPALVPLVAAAVARLRKTEVEAVERTTGAAFEALFGCGLFHDAAATACTEE